ncbi:MAG: glycerol-3-phosphate acyltransferase [Planctomycetes bacterium]|nr:glycerol-3-phosphate acyltransferase [Planctomycetota bacterium]
MTYGKEILVIGISYLLGCISAGYYLVRLRTGKDIRQSGTGSTGARNVSRTLGKSGYAITLTVDILKAAIAVALAQILNVEQWAVMLAVLAVVAGHIWPVQLGFRAGKGVAVLMGALLVFDYRLLAVLLLVCALSYFTTRKYIVSGILAVVSLPVAAVIMKYPKPDMLGVVLLTMIILCAHRTNIREVFQQSRRKANAISGSEK